MNIMIPAWVDGTLQPVEKLEAHKLGVKHKAISVFLFHNNKILLQRRALGKYHTPGLWANTCCTHPYWNETDIDCANRRVFEELHLTGLELKNRGKIEYRADVGQGLIEHEIVEIFTATCSAAPKVTPNPEEVMEIKWLDQIELTNKVETNPDEFTPLLRIYMSKHFEQISGTITA